MSACGADEEMIAKGNFRHLVDWMRYPRLLKDGYLLELQQGTSKELDNTAFFNLPDRFRSV